jgi:hypothetical protein
MQLVRLATILYTNIGDWQIVSLIMNDAYASGQEEPLFIITQKHVFLALIHLPVAYMDLGLESTYFLQQHAYTTGTLLGATAMVLLGRLS